jgi:hypothetical protein
MEQLFRPHPCTGCGIEGGLLWKFRLSGSMLAPVRQGLSHERALWLFHTAGCRQRLQGRCDSNGTFMKIEVIQCGTTQTFGACAKTP